MWHKGIYKFIKGNVLYISVSFTFHLPKVKEILNQGSFFWDKAIVGGPATKLMPGYLDNMPNVSILPSFPGILQQINPSVTRTSFGCPNKCPFCAVPIIEGDFKELENWPDLPILIDNNILASSQKHFDLVCDRLEKYDYVDFNQGIDIRLLTSYHAERLARLKGKIRLSLDGFGLKDTWEKAYTLLRKEKITKNRIYSYVLVGFNDSPLDAWKKTKWIKEHNVTVCPMWFHSLDCLEKNRVTKEQYSLGWNNKERKRIMQYYYKRKGVPLI